MRRLSRFGITVVLLAAVAVATAAVVGRHGAGSSTTKTVLTGKVVLDPATPVCWVGQPCSKPLVGFTLVFSRGGNVVARTTTGHGGRYRASLAPGRYAVKPAHARGKLEPARIAVPSASRTTVNFKYDAGIR